MERRRLIKIILSFVAGWALPVRALSRGSGSHVESVGTDNVPIAKAVEMAAGGAVFIGMPNTDPSKAENQIKVYLPGGEAIRQPIIIGSNGRLEQAGFVRDQAHSMAVYNSSGQQLFILPDIRKHDQSLSLSAISIPGFIGVPSRSPEDLISWGSPVIIVFKAVGDGKSDDSNSLINADLSGVPLTVMPGTYNIKNVSLGSEYTFLKGAVLYGSLGDKDNMILAKSGLKMTGAKFLKELVASPSDGDFGNAIRIGTYRQPNKINDSVNNVKIVNMSISSIGDRACQSIEVLGNAFDITISGFSHTGKGGGIVCHWGGDVGDNGDTSYISYSYHPHNITLENLHFSSGENGNPDHAVILSACYDVSVSNVNTEKTKSTLWIMPGDVYDEVAIPRDYGKPCTNIVIDGINATTPTDGEPAIRVDGVPKTTRNKLVKMYARDYSSKMSISIDNAKLTCDESEVYDSPMLLVQACSDVNVIVEKIGADRSHGYWAQLDYNRNSNIKVSGVSVSGPRSRGNTNCNIETNGSRGSYEFDMMDSGCRIENLIIGDSISIHPSPKGSTEIGVSSTNGNIIFNGAFVLKNGVTIATVLESATIAAGKSVSVKTTPIQDVISSEDKISFVLSNTGTTFTGSLSGFQHAYRVIDGWGFKIKSIIENSAMYGVFASGDYLKDVSIVNCDFSGNSSQSGGHNINVTASEINNVNINENKFDVDSANANIVNHINISTSNHHGLVISNNAATKTKSGVTISIHNSTNQVPVNLQQIFGNSFPENFAPQKVVIGQYADKMFSGFIRTPEPPTDGYFEQGTRIYRGASETTKGWDCVSSGVPGEWKAFG